MNSGFLSILRRCRRTGIDVRAEFSVRSGEAAIWWICLESGLPRSDTGVFSVSGHADAAIAPHTQRTRINAEGTKLKIPDTRVESHAPYRDRLIAFRLFPPEHPFLPRLALPAVEHDQVPQLLPATVHVLRGLSQPHP